MKTVFNKYLWVALVCLGLSGCGFHLRGVLDIPQWLDNVAIINKTGDRYLEANLKESLQGNHIHVCDDPTKASYQLILMSNNFRQQISSVSSSTTPRQYQLTYNVWFTLQQVNSGKQFSPSQVIVTRQVTINSDRILGSNFEEALTKKEMIHDAIIQILLRLERYHT